MTALPMIMRWIHQADVDDGVRPGVSTEESKELRELRRRNKTLEQENEILRRAAAYFAKEIRMSSISALARVDKACARLRQENRPVTFTAVAAATGLSRTTLYRDTAVRAVIENHRARAASSGTLAGITEEIALLRTALDALAYRVRRHEEQIRKLADRVG